ncbi:MAG: efflux RND transporter periplasmic adaptor subunit [Myxococcales bacterium]|nr:efflux RND transporter periplasmic adaptor subunit [Myxococcales bacterium]MCB9700412.1 efflux RND transporter periplasmic adaptor subunit [Myxococcales bacterium]
MNRRTVALNVILAVLAIAVAIAGAGLMIVSRPQPEKAEQVKPEVRVRVMIAHPAAQDVEIDGMGEVKPAHELIVQPEIAGRVTFRSDNLIPGGIVPEGEILARIDARDAAAAIAAQQAAIAQARLSLADEKGRRDVAASDWAGREQHLNEDSRDFALRQPHIDSAKASLSSAQAQLAKAKRDQSKSVIRAPFDAVVREVTIEVGQLATQSTRLATLVNVDRYWVEVSVPVANLAHLDIPGINVAGLRGSPAEVVLDAGPGVKVERRGYIERLLSAVDSRGRMARILIAVEDPLALGTDIGNRPLPLLLGSHVRVELAGKAIEDAVRIPRSALVDGKFVWLVADSKLTRREIDVVWRDRDSVVAKGLRQGEAVLVTPLPAPTEGLEVIVDEEIEADREGGGSQRELTSLAGKG